MPSASTSAFAGAFAPACNTFGVATQPKQRNLGRLSEIAQVAVRHGFGYVVDVEAPRGAWKATLKRIH